MNRLDAIVLAGGAGSRLRAMVPHVPKALAPIQGTPFLQILLRQTRSFRLQTIVMALGVGADQIIPLLEQEADVAVSLEPSPLGTGGAILWALPKTQSSTLLIVNGDTFVPVDWEPFLAAHVQSGAGVTLLARRESNPSRYGSIALNAEGYVLRFEEKASGSEAWISCGMYLVERCLFDSFATGQAYSLERDMLPRWIGRTMRIHPHAGAFIDIGTPASYHEAQQYLTPWLL